MASSPLKRGAGSVDPASDDDERASVTKRVKLEHVERRIRDQSARADHGNDESDDEHRDLSDEDDDMTGGGEDDCEDVDANIEAMQAQRERDRVLHQAEGGEAAGLVKQINLVNFMCHANLSVDFAHKMNFVVGHNGSGKSAVLTGIAVALGAKASVTGRGAGLKSLIMRGKDKATVTLVMTNRGPDAFMPDTFGDEIVIERTFGSTGFSGYKFRGSKKGNIISTKRELLTKMRRHWRINVDSPLVMLTQDNAKTFLARTDPKAMYGFFLTGTGLAGIMDEYRSVKATADKISLDLASAKSALPEQRAKVDKYERQIQLATKARDLQLRCEGIKAKMAWAFVIEKTNTRDASVNAADQLREKVDKIVSSLEEIDKKREEATADVQTVEEDIRKMGEENKEAQQEVKGKRKKKHDAQMVVTSHQQSINHCSAEIDEAQAEIEEMEQKLAAARREKEGDIDPAQLELEKKLKEAETILSGMLRQLPQSERAVADAKAGLDEQERLSRRAEGGREEVERQLATIRRNMENLRERRTDRLAPYGRNVQSVINEIRKAQWTHSPPIGPLGLHVQLKNDTYRQTIQNLLGPTLCAFAVRHQADQAQLYSIFERCRQRDGFLGPGGQMPTVIKHSGDLFDYSNGDFHKHGLGDTILSTLNITDDNVARILINAHGIERAFVAETDDDALNLINRVVGPRIPRATVHTARGFTQTGQFHPRLNTSGPQKQWRGNQLFVRDVASEIDTLKREAAKLEEDLRGKREELATLRTATKSAREALGKAEAELKRNQRGIPDVKRRIETFQDKLQAMKPVDGNATEIALETVRQRRRELEAERDTLLGDHAVKEQALVEAVDDLDQTLERMRSFDEDRNRKLNAYENLKQQLAHHDRSEKHYKGSLERTRTELAAIEASIEEANTTIEDWTRLAQQFGECPDEVGDSGDLQKELALVERQIEEAKKRSKFDLDQVNLQFVTESEKYQRQVQLVDKFSKIERILKDGFDDRTMRWNKLRRHISMRINTTFIHNLRKRRFDGKLNMEHDMEELHIFVTTSSDVSTQREVVYKNPSSLSGGERSFATVSLLLAMWDQAPSNLRCLDEWDVFLDAANRRIAGGQLVEASKLPGAKQFILISPLDMNGVNADGPGNKVIRLADPVRNQHRLEEYMS